jgi:tripartite-type tricarboxylate transporter receptor subunit TctC
MMNTSVAATTAFLSMLLTLSAPAHAQDKYPSKPITIIVAYAPGGSGDLMGRALGRSLEAVMGQPVAVVNKGGAAGAIGTQAAAVAPPDGYTLTVGSVDIAMTPAVNELFGRPQTFKRSDLVPIARVAADPNFLAVNAEQKWKTLKELVDDAKARPYSIVYTSGGLYGATHLPIEMFTSAAGIRMRHLPSNGGGPAMVAVLGNNAALLAVHPGVVRGHAAAGKVRVLASWGSERSKYFPEVPTFKELGYDIEHLIWWAVFVPAKTPPDVVKVLREAVAKAAHAPEFVDLLDKAGSTPAYMDQPEFAPWWDANSKRLEDAVRAARKP